jgi:hypothetical protein
MTPPSGPKNSCPAISMSIVRAWIFRRSVPSVRIVQMRSTLCQGPSWQNMISVGSVGENWMWLSHSVLGWNVRIAPVLMSMAYSRIGRRAAQRASRSRPRPRGIRPTPPVGLRLPAGGDGAGGAPASARLPASRVSSALIASPEPRLIPAGSFATSRVALVSSCVA